MFFEPIKSRQEVLANFIVIRVGALESFRSALSPSDLTVVKVPLIAKSHDALIARSRREQENVSLISVILRSDLSKLST